jgi:hypothetical protein
VDVLGVALPDNARDGGRIAGIKRGDADAVGGPEQALAAKAEARQGRHVDLFQPEGGPGADIGDVVPAQVILGGLGERSHMSDVVGQHTAHVGGSLWTEAVILAWDRSPCMLRSSVQGICWLT